MAEHLSRKRLKKIATVPNFIWLVLILLIFFTSFAPKISIAEEVTLQLRWDHQFQFAGYYAAKWQNYYKDSGLDVNIKSALKPAKKILSVTKEVSEGHAEFGIGGADILIANEQRVPLVVLAVIFQQSGAEFYTKQETHLNSLADILRLRVARSVNDLVDVELQAMLRAEGIDPNLVTPYPHEPGVKHLEEGRVDVIPGYSISMPYRGIRGDLKLRKLRPSSYGINFYGDSLFTSKKLVDQKPELIERFVDASLRGWKYALEHPIEIADRISAEMHRTGPLKDFKGFNRFQVEGVKKLSLYSVVQLGHINPYRWKRMHSFLEESGLIQKDLSLREFIYDPSRLEREREQTFQKLLKGGFAVASIIGIVSFAWILILQKNNMKRKQIEAALRESEEKHRALFDTMDQGVVYQDVEGKIISANPAAERLLGLSLDQLVGRTSLDPRWHTVHEDGSDFSGETHPSMVALRTGEEVKAVVMGVFKNRTDGYRWLNIYATPQFRSGEDTPYQVYTTFDDISERKLTENRINASLKEKELLLGEIHHRVKNNMMVVCSLLRLQGDKIEDKKLVDIFKESENRIRSMSMVHEKLYQTKDFANVNFAEYVRSLTNILCGVYTVNPKKVKLKIDIEDVKLDIENAIPCGLLINELVSNSMKHAFPDEREGNIDISLRSISEDELELIIADNGVGMPEDIDIKKTGSMGLQLVKVLVDHQLGSKIEIDRTAGTQFHIKLKRKKYKKRI